MPDNNKITALYCRVATADQPAIDLQRENLRAYAKRQGYENIEIYEDNGKSGLTFDRPGMNRLQSDIHDGKVGRIVTVSLSRIGRNSIRIAEWMSKLKEMGVAFETPDRSHELVSLLDTHRSLSKTKNQPER